MKQFDDFLADGHKLVCLLSKSVYGLQQSLRNWNQALDAQLKLMGLKQYTNVRGIYMSTTKFILAMNVDKILLVGKSQQKIISENYTIQG